MDQSERRKTVFLVHTNDPSKVQGSTEVHYVTEFLSERCDLHIFAPGLRSDEDAVSHALPIRGISGVVLLNLVLAPYWLYHLLNERPDIVYCYENVILPALLGRWVTDATVAYDLRSDPYQQGREFSEQGERDFLFRSFLLVGKYFHGFALKRAHYVFVLSEPLADAITSNYGVSRNAIRLLPLGVDTDQFAPAEESHDRTSIVYVGSIASLRDIGTVIDAVTGLAPGIQREIRVDLYGGGPEEYISDLMEQASGTPVEVNWHGMIPHEEIPERAGKSDIAVSPLPPYDAYEVSSPAKLFEYLALGLPVVASRITPHERILDEQENALFFEPESAVDLRDKLKTLIDNDELRAEYARNARATAFAYSWEERFSIVEDTLRLRETSGTRTERPGAAVQNMSQRR